MIKITSARGIRSAGRLTPTSRDLAGIGAALRRCRTRERLVLALVLCEHLTMAEAGRALGVPERAVARMYRTLLAELRRSLRSGTFRPEAPHRSRHGKIRPTNFAGVFTNTVADAGEAAGPLPAHEGVLGRAPSAEKSRVIIRALPTSISSSA